MPDPDFAGVDDHLTLTISDEGRDERRKGGGSTGLGAQSLLKRMQWQAW